MFKATQKYKQKGRELGGGEQGVGGYLYQF